jgi:hypothetical protein
MAAILYRRLMRQGIGVAGPFFVWLKDILQTFVWASAFIGNRIEWRGDYFRLRRDGTMRKEQACNSPLH